MSNTYSDLVERLDKNNEHLERMGWYLEAIAEELRLLRESYGARNT